MLPTLTTLLVLLGATASGTADSPPSGFTISLVGSGEVIVSDQDIASYDWDRHRIYVTPEGLKRWADRIPRNPANDPPTPMLAGSLHGKRFRVSLDGTEMYQGTIWSFASSRIQSGVTLGEPLDGVSGFLTFRFRPAPGTDSRPDPRARPEIRKYFQEQGRLRLGDEPAPPGGRQ